MTEGTAVNTTFEERVQLELEERCAWYEQYLKIRDEHGDIIPFVPNEIQVKLEEYAIRCELDGKPCYVLALKARQGGISTWSEAHLFRKTLLEPNTRVLVTAHKEDASRNIFGMARRFYANLPRQPGTKKSATNALHMKHNDSEFVVQTAGSGSGAGRSYTFSGWHASETDLWPDGPALFTAVMQCVPKVGGTIRILESTSEGPGYLMHDLWTKAYQGKGSFKPFFFAWHSFRKYTMPITWETLMKFGPQDFTRRYSDVLREFVDIEQEDRRNAVDPVPELADRHETGNEVADSRIDPGSGGQSAGESGSEQDVSRGPEEAAGERGRDLDDPVGWEEDPGAGKHAARRKRAAAEGRRMRRIEDGRGTDGHLRNRCRNHRNSITDDDLFIFYAKSLTDYEFSLIADFDLDYEQINCLRFLTESECNGDEQRRLKEYPSRPEECFSSSGGDVLDGTILAKWHKAAKDNPGKRIKFLPEYDHLGRPVVKWDADKSGAVQIYRMPQPHEEFVMALDCAQGTADGDWHVAVVLDVETGDQVAEYRSKNDPDEAVDQIELLAMLYNRAYTGIEVSGGWGWPFLSHMSQRAGMNGVPLYERVAYDKRNGIKVKVKRPGWDTNTKTRPHLVAASKEAVRKQFCRLHSIETIEECQTLHANMNKGGKVEARSGQHDDGWMAYSLACLLRSEKLANREVKVVEESKKKFPLFAFVHEKDAARAYRENSSFGKMELRQVVEPTCIMPESADKRRSSL